MADDANDRVTVEITNNDQGPRYVHTARGMEVVRPGETLSTEMNGAQATAAEDAVIADTDGVPMWSIDKVRGRPSGDVASDQGRALDKLTLSELRKLADAEDVPLTDRKDTDGSALPDLTKAADIRAAIEVKRADNPNAL